MLGTHHPERVSVPAVAKVAFIAPREVSRVQRTGLLKRPTLTRNRLSSRGAMKASAPVKAIEQEGGSPSQADVTSLYPEVTA